MRRRAAELATSTRLAASTVLSHLREDPSLLAVQLSRRAPRRVTQAVGATLRRSRRPLTRATGSWLLGRLDEARDELAGALGPGAGRTRGRVRRAPLRAARRRWAAELAVHLGAVDLLPDGALDASPPTTARARWQRGDLSGAVAALDGDRRGAGLRARLVSERHVATVGTEITVPTVTKPPVSRPALTRPAPRPRQNPQHPAAEHPGLPELPEPTERPAISVLHVLTNSLPHTQSGYAHRSHAVLRAQQAAGLHVTAATRLGYPVTVGKVAARYRDTVDGVDYRRLVVPSPGATLEERLQQTAALLLPIADEVRADVLHATTNYTNGLVARAVARELGIPWVYEVRGLLEETWVASRPAGTEQETASRSEKYRVLRDRETELAVSADHVFTLSETLRDELVERGVDRGTISLVPNAVDAGLLDGSLDPVEARRALGLPADGFWVGTVSSLVDYEGFDTLLDAVALLRARGVDARALIVGDGVSRGPLEAQARRLGIAGVTLFTGRVPRSQALMHHQALDVFVVPRRDVRVCRLVTPLKPIEAMAYGRPVVASDLPALAEIVERPRSGVLVPAGDGGGLADVLERLAADPGLRRALGARGHALARTRTWASVGETYRARLSGLTATGATA